MVAWVANPREYRGVTYVSVVVDLLLIQIWCWRGDVDITVAAKDAPNERYRFSQLARVLEIKDVQRPYALGLKAADQLRVFAPFLEPAMEDLKRIFADGVMRDLKQRVAEMDAKKWAESQIPRRR